VQFSIGLAALFTHKNASAMPTPLNVLFLCTHNSARSILAEALLNHLGQGKFKGFSAGSSPRANQQPNPLGLQVLRDAGIATDGLHSKSWDAFALPNAPQMDLVITVCNNAAGEQCPLFNPPQSTDSGWPSKPARAHWGYADPSAGDAPDEQKLIAFRHTLHALSRRIELLVDLPAASLDKLTIESSAQNLSAS
jgi:arsenate reductase (thioredoxin)